jgi:uncharacterized small protein (DUF1192 family)
MGAEEFEPEKRAAVEKNLEEMSIESLGEYIAELEVEICRVRDVITEKKVAKTNAKSFFK